jgi:hypothetical protein
MKSLLLLFFCGCPVLVAHVAHAAAPPSSFERYEIILDRMPFGEAPPEPTAEPAPVPPSESFAKNLRVCSIIEEEDSGIVKVGIVDNESKKNFVLREGEIVDQIELVSASLADEEAVLRKGEELARINLVSGEITSMSADQLASRTPPATSSSVQASASNAARQSYRDRRKARQELRRLAEERKALRDRERKEAAELAQRYTGEELRQQLEDYNMEVIRAGMPALPIPLRPEQDLQLVEENVLPPLEGQYPEQSLVELPQPQPAYDDALLEQLGDIPIEDLLLEEQLLEEVLLQGF